MTRGTRNKAVKPFACGSLGRSAIRGIEMELGTLLTTGSAAIDLTTKLAEIVKKYQDFNDELKEINSDFFLRASM